MAGEFELIVTAIIGCLVAKSLHWCHGWGRLNLTALLPELRPADGSCANLSLLVPGIESCKPMDAETAECGSRKEMVEKTIGRASQCPSKCRS